jgi:hypothetical protein
MAYTAGDKSPGQGTNDKGHDGSLTTAAGVQVGVGGGENPGCGGPGLSRAASQARRSTTRPDRDGRMVSATNLNFDVLQIIFSYLSPHDLASVSQVNQSFLAGALPRLYRSLGFYHNQAKRYPRVRCRFRP